MTMPINTLLLSWFTAKPIFTAEPSSAQQKYYTLHTMYLSLLMLTALLLHKISNASMILEQTDEATYGVALLIITSLILLKGGKTSLAAPILLGSLHLTIYKELFTRNMPTASLFLVSLLPTLGFLLIPSQKAQNLNVVLCFVQNLICTYKMRAALNPISLYEQEAQISCLQHISFISIMIHWIYNHLRENMNINLMNPVRDKLKRIENVTQEMVQATSEKDSLVTSISQEVGNGLLPIINNMNSLLNLVKDPMRSQMLRNSRSRLEILLNQVTNILDVGKVRTNKVSFNYMDAAPVELVENLLRAHEEALNDRKVSVEAVVYKDVPASVKVDPLRIMQIMLNLMSNAIKFNKPDGKIKIIAEWVSSFNNLIDLKQPTSLDPFEVVANPITDCSRDFYQKQCSLDNQISLPTLSPEKITSEFTFSTVINHQSNIDYLKGMTPKNMRHINPKRGSLEEAIEQESHPWKITREIHSNYKHGVSWTSIHQDLLPEENCGKKGTLKIQISDNGCGIPESKLQGLFNLSTSRDPAVVHRHGGVGFSLGVSRSICRKMGGDVTVHSKEGYGTTFVFYIPVNSGFSEENIRQRTPGNFGEVRALLVDGSGFSRDLNRFVLEREEVQVTAVGSSSGAMREFNKYGEGHFNFVIVDMNMLERDGFTTIKEMRECEIRAKWRETGILAMLGDHQEEDEMLQELKLNGLDAKIMKIRVVRKPLEVKTIKKIIEESSKKDSKSKL